MLKEISTIDEYPMILRDKYWEVVAACMVEIFDVDSSRALQLVFSLRQDCEKNLSPKEQLFMYHQEAFNTAAGLVNQGFGTGLNFIQYRKICERLGWTPEGVDKLLA